MKKLNLIFGLSIVLFFAACSDDEVLETVSEDYLIFGHFFGLCAGEGCVETYKLENNSLFEDTKDEYRASSGFDFEKLDDVKYELVKDLQNILPTELTNLKDSTFGCPDCADGGGLVVQLKQDDAVSTWFIDRSTNNIPSYLHEFRDSIIQKISIINE